MCTYISLSRYIYIYIYISVTVIYLFASIRGPIHIMWAKPEAWFLWAT